MTGRLPTLKEATGPAKSAPVTTNHRPDNTLTPRFLKEGGQSCVLSGPIGKSWSKKAKELTTPSDRGTDRRVPTFKAFHFRYFRNTL